MTGREWAPGDVAMVTLPSGAEEKAVFDGWNWFGYPGLHWSKPTSARLLSTIDPEDRAQAQRLADLFVEADSAGMYNTADESTVSSFQRALREFAAPTPPPIDEPTNRLAIVRDKGGDEWVHVGEHVWRSISSTGAYMVEKHWDDYEAPLAGNVTEVVAEGIA